MKQHTTKLKNKETIEKIEEHGKTQKHGEVFFLKLS